MQMTAYYTLSFHGASKTQSGVVAPTRWDEEGKKRASAKRSVSWSNGGRGATTKIGLGRALDLRRGGGGPFSSEYTVVRRLWFVETLSPSLRHHDVVEAVTLDFLFGSNMQNVQLHRPSDATTTTATPRFRASPPPTPLTRRTRHTLSR